MRALIAAVFAVFSCVTLGVSASVIGAAPRNITVQAVAETEPVGTLDDAADDPAIWRNTDDPSASLIVATDKRAGLHIYDLYGKARGFTASPRLNNVDLLPKVRMNGRDIILVAASDRADERNARMALFRLDSVKPELIPISSIAVGTGEAYGMCLWQRKSDQAVFGFVVMKSGRIDQVALNLSGVTPTGRVVRKIKLKSQSEGCVVDARTGTLYVAEEDVGIWKIRADPSASAKPVLLARIDKTILVMDAEGLALAPEGNNGGHLIASSQGDNAYSLYSLPNAKFAGRFQITAGTIDGTSETDGLELALGDFGPRFPNGVLVVQDGDNTPDTQNFKLVSWGDVIRALKQ
jgi:3-phytase